MRYLTLLRTLGLGLLLVAGLPSLASAALFTTLQSAATATGNGGPLTVNDKGTVGVAVTGTFVGTVTFEGSTNANVNWSSLNCTTIDTLVTATTTTTTGQFTCNTAGLTGFRARISAYTSGSITVTAFPTAAGGGSGSGGAGSSVPTLAGCWATAASPTYVEGVLNAVSCTLSGLLRVSVDAITVLISGEDQTNNLLMTSGGAVRGTVGNVATLTTDATSTAVQLPTGTKRIRGTLDAAGAQTQTVKIYGGDTSGVTASTGDLLCTLTFTVATHDQAVCPLITTNYLWYIAVSSGTTGSPTGVITATY